MASIVDLFQPRPPAAVEAPADWQVSACRLLRAWPRQLNPWSERFAPLTALRGDQALQISLAVTKAGSVAAEVALLARGPAMPDCDTEVLDALLNSIWPTLDFVTAPSDQPDERPIIWLEAGTSEASVQPALRPLFDPAGSNAPCEWPWRLGAALRLLQGWGGGALHVRFQAQRSTPALRSALAEERAMLLAASYRDGSTARTVQRLAWLDAMATAPVLVKLAVGVSGCGGRPLSILAKCLFDDRLVSAAPGAASCFWLPVQLPLRWFPLAWEVAALRRANTGSAGGRSPDRALAGELVLGRVQGRLPIGLSTGDRTKHLYILGGTGTGKSTLMRDLIAQDARSGEAVVLIDPHGDLAAAATADAIALGRSDVIVADASAGTLQLDLLDSANGTSAELVRDNLVGLFRDVLYTGNGDAFGPVFEQYFGHALTLLLHAPRAWRCLTRFPAIFEESAFRDRLLESCPDRDCRRFWLQTAMRTQGELALVNITPYITAKLNRLIGSETARAIFASKANAVDFAQSLDAGAITIIRAPVGLLGRGLARLVTMAVIMQLRQLLMARECSKERPTVRVYLDELQGAQGSETEILLAEGRKFGLSLVMANQSLSQLGGLAPGSTGAAVLSNVGNLMVLRIGAQDAAMLDAWLAPDIVWQSLSRQPDFTGTARLLRGGVPEIFSDIRLAPLVVQP